MEITDCKGCIRLNNGISIPNLGLGVFKAKEGEEVENAVRWALESGYRHIDTASLYGNERGVGQAIKNSRISREEIFITTKLWNTDQIGGTIIEAFEASLRRLQTEYIDLYLVHYPIEEKLLSTWKIMEQLYASGKIKAIGVSNFEISHLEKLLPTVQIVPAINQVECHPFYVRQALQDYCRTKGIVFEAWRPIMNGKVNRIALLKQIAGKYGKTPSQIALRWELQKGMVVIPKSVHKDRIISNSQLFDFALTPEEISQIDMLDRNKEIRAHPLLHFLYGMYKKIIPRFQHL